MVTISEGAIFIFPAIYGILVAFIELIFVHADERGLGWLGHGLHAVPWCIVMVYVSVNTWVVLSLLPFPVPVWAQFYAVPLVLGLVTTFKVKTAAAIARGGSVGEKFVHALIIGALVAAAPFVFWMLSSMGIAALAPILR